MGPFETPQRVADALRKLRSRRWRAGSALRDFARGSPSAQRTLDIFRGEWTSRLPPPLDSCRAGSIPLFEDDRIEWALAHTGGAAGRRVLELGPLEGGHTFMLHRAGADSIVAVEGNSRAFLKCLVTKELLGLDRAHFLYGDLTEYLRHSDDHFDLCVASGVLYHLRNPAQLIALLAGRADRLFLWTHYYDAGAVARNPRLARRLSPPEPAEHEGFRHHLSRYRYGVAVRWAGFYGGSSPFSCWMSRGDILRALDHFGWSHVILGDDSRDHPNGPSLSLVASP